MESSQFRLKIEVGAKLARAAGMAQAAEGLLFELADTLTGQAEFLANLFQAVGLAILQPKAQLKYLGFSWG